MRKVYVLYCQPNSLNLSQTEILLSFLSDYEKMRYDSFAQLVDKSNYVVSHSLLRMGLSQFINIPVADFEIENYINEMPKILLPHEAKLFNITISHTKGLVCCGFSTDFEIGIDIEKDENCDLFDIYSYCLTKNEIDSISGSSSEKIDFLKLWTMKESFLKAKGVGLKFSLLDFECNLDKNSLTCKSILNNDNDKWDFKFLELEKGYVCSLAIKNSDNSKVDINVRNVSLLELTRFFELERNYARNN